MKTQTCYPGCATVDGAMVCGTALLLTAGSMKAAIELMAKSDGLSVDEFCNRFGTLCAAAKSGAKAKPKTFTDDTICKLIGTGGSSHPGRQVTCSYNCAGEGVKLVLEPGQVDCPGEGPKGIKWSKIKHLPQDLK